MTMLGIVAYSRWPGVLARRRAQPPVVAQTFCDTKARVRRRWVIWVLVLSGWTALAVFFAVSSSLTFVAAYQPPQWRLTLLMSLTEWFAWAALTPLVAWLARRFPLRAGSFVTSLAVHAPAGFFIAVLKVTLTRILRIPIVRTNEYFIISNLATHYVIYWAIVAAVHALAYYRAGREGELRASQLEARLADARLQLLKMQLHPHFLFNTLNTISELVHEDPAHGRSHDRVAQPAAARVARRREPWIGCRSQGSSTCSSGTWISSARGSAIASTSASRSKRTRATPSSRR